MTYAILKILIENNRYTYDDMFNKLDLFLALDRINYEQYVELSGMLVVPPSVEETPAIEEEETEKPFVPANY